MLDGIDVFVRVVDVGSFTAAAEQLGKSTSFVSKEVTRLENRLGTRLLNRTTRSISLTDVGRLYFERCQQIIVDAVEAERSVTETRAAPRGVLKLSAPVSFGLGYLAAVLPEFLDANPELALDVEFNDRMVDVIAEGFDVVLRIGHLKDSSLITRQINSSRGLTVASPKYWKQNGKPRHPSELAGHTCISYSLMPAPARWRYLDPESGPINVTVDTRIQCNSAELETALAVAGVGVTRLPEFACSKELGKGLLEPVLEQFSGSPIGIYAVYPHRRHLSAKVRVFVDFLVTKFGGRLDPAARQ
jgi:DNA-binding transcriptional LysR family regulator